MSNIPPEEPQYPDEGGQPGEPPTEVPGEEGDEEQGGREPQPAGA